MRSFFWLAMAPVLAYAQSGTVPPGPGEVSNCPDCHLAVQAEYQRSRMSMAARTPHFLVEWKDKGGPQRCLTCHAPSGGEGVGCGDCHGIQGHPYPKLSLPDVCARCHDAPGEVTVRSFLDSPAARRGENCLNCHLQGEKFSHDFMGPGRPGFLDNIASLNLSLRRDTEGLTVLIRVSHRAGHALPGGTTGRSVWLVVEEVDAEDATLARSLFRFGWFHDASSGWQDWTLAPGPGKVMEIPLLQGSRTFLIRARLIYRFRPGLLDEPDPLEVVLDQAEFSIPADATET